MIASTGNLAFIADLRTFHLVDLLQLRASNAPWFRLRVANAGLLVRHAPQAFWRSLQGTTGPKEAAFPHSPGFLPDAGPTLDASGYKLAYLHAADQPYRGLYHGAYTTACEASCARRVDHPSPSSNCSCGFYAFTDSSRALAHWPSYPDAVLLSVELYGELVLHREGWRGAYQEVTGVMFRPDCWFCSSRAAGVVLAPPAPLGQLQRALEADRFLPTCRSCASTAFEPLSALRSALGTEVSWAW